MEDSGISILFHMAVCFDIRLTLLACYSTGIAHQDNERLFENELPSARSHFINLKSLLHNNFGQSNSINGNIHFHQGHNMVD